MLLTKNKKQKTKDRGQEGISILFAVLIMTVILAIGSGISSIFIQQARMIKNVGHSVIAFYAADSGIEEILLMDVPADISETPLDNGAKYEVFVRTSGEDCEASNYCIKSIGSYKETRRAIEIEY